ncbi:MAG: winged helix-turn-helix domain-containing protein [Pseudomonadota bacterium]
MAAKYQFGAYVLDVDRAELCRSGKPVSLRPKSFDVLRYLVEHQGRIVTKEQLLKAVWNTSVVSDDSIARCLADIRKAIQDTEHTKIKTVPRRGYTFELPVEEATADEQARPVRRLQRSVVIATAIAGVLIVCLIGLLRFSASPDNTASMTSAEQADPSPEYLLERSIAVLPFADMSPESDQAWFADGIAEEIINILSQTTNLNVIARTSSFSFRNRDADIAAIAKRLKVTHVLEGSVRKSGDEVRITVQLINTADATHVWSETYSHEYTEIFSVQDDIAQTVARLMDATIGEVRASEVMSSSAYSLYLRANYIVDGWQMDRMSHARQLIGQALELEPQSLPALDLLATIETLTAQQGDSTTSVERIARTMMEISPRDPRALAWMAYVKLRGPERDYQQAADYLQQALAGHPSDVELLGTVGYFLRLLGRMEDARRVSEYALLRDPLCTGCLHTYSVVSRELGEPQKAIDVLVDAESWHPDRQSLQWSLGAAMLQAGDADGALNVFQREQDAGLRELGSILALHSLGRDGEFEQRFADYRDSYGGSKEPLARIHAWVGDDERATALFDEYAATVDPVEAFSSLQGGWYRHLRGTPTFEEMLRRHGIGRDFLKDVVLNVELPEGLSQPSGP